FLVSCRNIEWSTMPSILMGVGVMIFALIQMNWQFDMIQVLAFLLLMVCGISITYSFLLLLTSSSIWLMRNQSLYEILVLFTSLMRYPKEIFQGWAFPMGWFFTFIIPVLIAVNVPAETMAKEISDGWLIGFMLVTTVVLAWLSRKVFRTALKRYRSA